MRYYVQVNKRYWDASDGGGEKSYLCSGVINLTAEDCVDDYRLEVAIQEQLTLKDSYFDITMLVPLPGGAA